MAIIKSHNLLLAEFQLKSKTSDLRRKVIEINSRFEKAVATIVLLAGIQIRTEQLFCVCGAFHEWPGNPLILKDEYRRARMIVLKGINWHTHLFSSFHLRTSDTIITPL